MHVQHQVSAGLFCCEQVRETRSLISSWVATCLALLVRRFCSLSVTGFQPRRSFIFICGRMKPVSGWGVGLPLLLFVAFFILEKSQKLHPRASGGTRISCFSVCRSSVTLLISYLKEERSLLLPSLCHVVSPNSETRLGLDGTRHGSLKTKLAEYIFPL